MEEYNTRSDEFLTRITSLVEANISNEQFGVSELAREMNMSRSNLLRKVNKLTGQSVSQFIRNVRLKKAMEMLKQSSFNVSEISHRVGFGSTSYFIKCFREYYGYPPGEAGKRIEEENKPEAIAVSRPIARKRKPIVLASVGLAVVIVVSLFTYFARPLRPTIIEKSIAVLPFKNDSGDSTNLYLINGLMESTLNNLQKIKDLRVISRTSSEKYRNTTKSVPEMAEELNVNYFVVGSGQKIGDQLLLNIQLVDASSDRHLWARQYRREAKDIFELQQEIAKNIAQEIQAIITPDEKKRIEQIPTTDLEAYDFFLKGRDLLHQGSRDNLISAIDYFEKAIARDEAFALAYAHAAIAYYYLDIFQVEKKYMDEIGSYADKALLIDAKQAESLTAKALYYMHKKEYDLALPYLEKALEYNPNAVTVISFLSDFYAFYRPNTTKYLEYALKGLKLDVASQDSSTTSYSYLHLGNALVQAGFIEEALRYIDKSIAYFPDNPYSKYVRAWILLARDKDCNRTKNLLVAELKKDTTRLDILQDVAKTFYLMKEYDSAWHYYKQFIELREARQLDIYKHESLKIAIVLAKLGMKEKADEYLHVFKEFAENDRSIYKHAHLAGYFAYRGEAEKAIEHLKLFSKEDNVQYWILLMPEDPGIGPIKNHPGFKEAFKAIETKFWARHEEIRRNLEDQGLI